MIDSLDELNEVVNNVVNYIVSQSTQKTTTGNWIFEYADVSHLIEEFDYLQYFDLIANELASRDEVLDLDSSDHQLDAIYGLSYCPNYEWVEGDEQVFDCSEEEWYDTFKAEPVSQPLSMTRLSEIGTNAIQYILETSDMAIEDLTEVIGMSMAELKQLGIYDPDPEFPPNVIVYETYDAVTDETFRSMDIEEALRHYRSLGDRPSKSFDAVIPPGQPYSGRHMLLSHQNGFEALVNADYDKPEIEAMHRYFAGRPMASAFAAAALYYKEKVPIQFFVKDEIRTGTSPDMYTSFDAALKGYHALDSAQKSMFCQVYDKYGHALRTLLVRKDAHGRDQYCFVPELTIAEYAHVALAHAKVRLSLNPEDEYAWQIRDSAELRLGITDRFPDVSKDLVAGKWRVRYIPTGGHYGAHNASINEGKPLVEFYDTSADPQAFGPFGQLVTRYYADTLLGRDGYSTGNYPYGLQLDADIPEWTVSKQEMLQVLSYLKDCSAPSRHPPLGSAITDAKSRQQNMLPENPAPEAPDR